MPRWRQKAVCGGNSGWCVRPPGSPVWKMPAFQTSPGPSANIPPSQPFSLCHSRSPTPPPSTCLSSRPSFAFFTAQKASLCFFVALPLQKKKKSDRCFDTSYEAQTRKNTSLCANAPLSHFLDFPSDRKVDPCRTFFFFLQIHLKRSCSMPSVSHESKWRLWQNSDCLNARS